MDEDSLDFEFGLSTFFRAVFVLVDNQGLSEDSTVVKAASVSAYLYETCQSVS